METNLNDRYFCTVGEYTYGNPKVYSWGEGSKLIVGKFCYFSPEVTILIGGEHHINWVTTYNFTEQFDLKDVKSCRSSKGDVVIGNDVWIGFGAMILSGVHIGSGAVIGAGAVVRDDVEPYSIVIGNPAITIKKRFDEETIIRLMNLRWWYWDIKKIKENIDFLLSPDIKKLLERT